MKSLSLARWRVLLVAGLFAPFAPHGRAEQVVISRVEQMPNLPQPYAMRNWRKAGHGLPRFHRGVKGYWPISAGDEMA